MFRFIIGLLIIIGSLIAGCYVGGWLMFVKAILNACAAYDAGTLTGMLIGKTVLMCLFASTVGSAIAYIGAIVGKIIMG